MTTSVDLSPELQDWIRVAGLHLTQGSRTNDNRTVVWSPGGETRYFIDFVDNYYVITVSDRMDGEIFYMGAITMPLLEKYLWGRFGGSIRKIRGLERLQKPFSIDELQEGCSIGKCEFASRERATLIDPTGTAVAIGAVDRLVELSHYLDVNFDTIKNSYLAPDGRPLFTLGRGVKG